ncbi:hypothetical protein [methane-oxidizing endosymbiont of Gigantopelta aegis]|uniref:hypothetical protein n=1 Tax=methane-oxidizing endosymbiont of Gigantopelta aegis TaxID=2794938 RepID=UPI0018DD6401|nr:hypothetical protein [methane-oxidizing endosymbiont of Gigantopelta aegis]
MKQISILLGLLLVMFVLPACTGMNKQAQSDVILTASSQAQIQSVAGLTALQRRYKAEQTAAIDAYRQLAALLFQQTLPDGARVGEKVVQDESFRFYVDNYLREAKVQRMHDKHFARVNLHLTLADRFRQCMENPLTVQHCLSEDNKLLFSRIGYRQATKKSVNLNCMSADCRGQFSIAGFSREKHVVDRALLQAGLYDSEWLLNTSAKIAMRYFLLTEFPPTHR